jgi:hypothetical protein
MEDLVAKLTDRLDAMNSEFKDSFRDVVAALKVQDDKLEFVQQKTSLLENSLHTVRAQIAEGRGACHTAPASLTEVVDKGNGILPRPPPQPLPQLNLPKFADLHPGEAVAAPQGGERRGWVPKMDFPKFAGSSPTILAEQCVAFFNLYDVPKSLWVTAATINMVDNAALWLQAYKAEHTLGSWDQFLTAVLEEFSLDEHERVLLDLLQIRQVTTVDDYWSRFSELKYKLRVHDPTASEKSLVLQFLHGLKDEIRAGVELHAPVTVAKAASLARKQEAILE